ncbi:hypothetical protein SNO00_003582 [Cronobacter sakazakii]|nr:hypothetical protein [Cronobacter sakazakii]
MTIDTAKLKAAAQEEIELRQVGDTSDNWQDLATPEAFLELIAALEAAENRNAELEACESNLQVNRPVVYGDGFYDGYWKARSEQSMSSEDENHG